MVGRRIIGERGGGGIWVFSASVRLMKSKSIEFLIVSADNKEKAINVMVDGKLLSKEHIST